MTEAILTICIPTYNRSKRLHLSLEKLLKEISALRLNSLVEIVVSDNNSQDETWETLLCMAQSAAQLGIKLNTYRNESNLGSSRNCMVAFLMAQTEYVIFLSDDDNVREGSLSEIIMQLIEYSPDVMICNFDQPPYTTANPLYPRLEVHQDVPMKIQSLVKLVKWFKLSGVVFSTRHKQNVSFLESEKELSPYFGHVLLSILVCLDAGSLVTTPTFFAYPDSDYLDHIDFGPYVTELLIKDLQILENSVPLPNTVVKFFLDHIPRVSVVSRSIHRLYEHYSKQLSVPIHVRRLLWRNIFLSFVLHKTISVEGLRMNLQAKDFLRLVRLLFYFFLSHFQFTKTSGR